MVYNEEEWRVKEVNRTKRKRKVRKAVRRRYMEGNNRKKDIEKCEVGKTSV